MLINETEVFTQGTIQAYSSIIKWMGIVLLIHAADFIMQFMEVFDRIYSSGYLKDGSSIAIGIIRLLSIVGLIFVGFDAFVMSEKIKRKKISANKIFLVNSIVIISVIVLNTVYYIVFIIFNNSLFKYLENYYPWYGWIMTLIFSGIILGLTILPFYSFKFQYKVTQMYFMWINWTALIISVVCVYNLCKSIVIFCSFSKHKKEETNKEEGFMTKTFLIFELACIVPLAFLCIATLVYSILTKKRKKQEQLLEEEIPAKTFTSRTLFTISVICCSCYSILNIVNLGIGVSNNTGDEVDSTIHCLTVLFDVMICLLCIIPYYTYCNFA